MKIVLEPNRGVSSFKVGDSIHSYLKLYSYKVVAAKEDESWDEYDFFDEKIEVYVDKETDIIETIACRYSCIYNSLELIGADFDEFLELIGKSKDVLEKDVLEKDVLWVSDTEQQTAYEIEDLLLQVWVTSDNSIACIFVGCDINPSLPENSPNQSGPGFRDFEYFLISVTSPLGLTSY